MCTFPWPRKLNAPVNAPGIWECTSSRILEKFASIKKYIDEIVAKYGFSQVAPVKTLLDKDIKLAKQDD